MIVLDSRIADAIFDQREYGPLPTAPATEKPADVVAPDAAHGSDGREARP
ncbi:hypothetical protein ACFSHR_01960 [Azotobacter chroococcum]